MKKVLFFLLVFLCANKAFAYSALDTLPTVDGNVIPIKTVLNNGDKIMSIDSATKSFRAILVSTLAAKINSMVTSGSGTVDTSTVYKIVTRTMTNAYYKDLISYASDTVARRVYSNALYVNKASYGGDTTNKQIYIQSQLNYKLAIIDTVLLARKSDMLTALNLKQDALVSGTNIRTVNGFSLLGQGGILLSSGSLLNTYNAGSNVWVVADDNTVTATKSGGVFTITVPAGVRCIKATVNVLASDIQTGADGSGAMNWINIIINSNGVGGTTGAYITPLFDGYVIPSGTWAVTNTAPHSETNESFMTVGTSTITWRRTNMVNSNDYVVSISGL